MTRRAEGHAANPIAQRLRTLWMRQRIGARPLRLWLALALLVLGVLAAHGSDLAFEWLAARFDLQLWRSDTDAARNAIATVLGIQVALLSVALSISIAGYQGLISATSPRLVSQAVAHAPLRRGLLLFVFSAGFALGAVRALGFEPEGVLAPRATTAGLVLLLVLTVGFVGLELTKVLWRLRIEVILRAVGLAGLRAVRLLGGPTARARVSYDPLAAPPPGAVALRARRTGAIGFVDAEALYAGARRLGLRVAVERRVGEEVVAGEPIGWALGDPGHALPARALARLARGVVIAESRSLRADPAFAIQVLVDIADRALSPAVNDPYTARQCLHRMREILLHLTPLPDGDWHLLDAAGDARVSIAAPTFRELLSLAVDGPLRYGAGDPAVLEGVLEVALSIGRAADRAERREAATDLVARVLDDATRIGQLDPGRLALLRERCDAVLAAIARREQLPPPEPVAAWGLAPAVAPSGAPRPSPA